MNWPKADQRLEQDAKILPRIGVGSGFSKMKPPLDNPTEGDMAEAALVMISDAAAAIRQLEQQAAKAVERARSIADATVEKLDAANDRAKRAERAQKTAEAEAADLNAALAATRSEMESLRNQFSTAEADLLAAQNRADHAEWQADEAERRAAEANAAVERIVNAIREQLPAGIGPATSAGKKEPS